MQKENDNNDNPLAGRYNEIREYFEKLFARKDKSANKTITRNSWFLKEDTQFQEMTGPNPMTPISPGNEMHMYQILRKLNGSEDLRKLSVEIPKFIDEVVSTLIASQVSLLRINNSIDTWQITENYSCLPDAISLLNGKVKEKDTMVSNLTVSINRIDYFPAGSYEFCFVYTSRAPNNPTMAKTRQAFIKSRNPIPIMQDRDPIMVKNQDWSNTFDSIELSALDLSKDPSLAGKETYSGSTLAEFWVTVKKSGEAFGNSPSLPFFRSLLSKVTELRTVSNDFVTTELEIPIDEKGQQKIVPGLRLQMTYEFDPITRASILSKIQNLFESVIHSRAEMQNIINEILDRYFPDISEQVKNILNRDEEVKPDRCDCSCIIV